MPLEAGGAEESEGYCGRAEAPSANASAAAEMERMLAVAGRNDCWLLPGLKRWDGRTSVRKRTSRCRSKRTNVNRKAKD